jgi:hypothetical protein
MCERVPSPSQVISTAGQRIDWPSPSILMFILELFRFLRDVQQLFGTFVKFCAFPSYLPLSWAPQALFYTQQSQRTSQKAGI